MKKEDRAIINKAQKILEGLYKTEDLLANDPKAVMTYCQLKIADKDHELFGVLFLNQQHRLIKSKILFRGTIDCAAVYPREVIKEAIACSSNAVIYFHNHPGGTPSPSEADKAITRKLTEALTLIDVRTLDHIIVSTKECYSFAEHGLI
jgi:DNA repair protein RadC